MSHFEELYQKLDPSIKQIRLVTIKPGKWKDDIQCTLQQTSLAVSEPYETLSYVWGDPTIRKEILVNGRAFQATVNLESALRHLRRDTPRTIWIDAICINQMDLEERASQVSFMCDIYQQSALTVIWLGDGDKRARSLFDFNLEDCYRDYNVGVRGYEDSAVGLGESISTDYRNQSLEFLATDLLMRPWWTRAWVLQEAVLSCELLVKCGTDEIPWMVLWSLVSGLSFGTYFPFLPTGVSVGDLEKVLKIQKIREAIKEGHQIPLIQLVAWNRQRRSTDARDKIFSLLGLAPDTSAYTIRPDYSPSNTLLDVCLDIVKQSIEQGSLDVICMSQGSKKARWPSWVPDWDVYSSENPEIASPLISCFANGDQIDTGEILTNSPSDYNASQSLQPRFGLLLNPPALRVAGVIIDTINHLAETCQPTKQEKWSLSGPDLWETLLKSYFEPPSCIPEISSWWHAIHDLRNSTPMRNLWPNMTTEKKQENRFVSVSIRMMKEARKSRDGCEYVGGGSLANAYIRTLIADTLVTGQRKDRGFDPLYTDIYAKNWLKSSKEEPESVDTDDAFAEDFLERYCLTVSMLDSAITRATSYRRLMVSSKGYIGLVPPGTQEGDLICVLYGCSVPVILRRQGDNYIFIGESYVHGIMDGEAIEQMNKGLLVEEEFTLV